MVTTAAQEIPLMPVGDEPVTVPLDVLPEWLEKYGLEITGWDERGYKARPKQARPEGGDQE